LQTLLGPREKKKVFESKKRGREESHTYVSDRRQNLLRSLSFSQKKNHIHDAPRKENHRRRGKKKRRAQGKDREIASGEGFQKTGAAREKASASKKQNRRYKLDQGIVSRVTAGAYRLLGRGSVSQQRREGARRGVSEVHPTNKKSSKG